MNYKSMTRATLGLVMLMAVTCLLASPTMAANPDSDQSSSDWRFELNSWLFLFGLDGEMGIGTAKVDINSTFFDIIDEADSMMALSGRLEIGYGKFGGFIDGSYVVLEYDNRSGPLGLASIDVTMEMAVVDFGLMYRLAEWQNESTIRKGSLDVYGGVRYTSIDLELDPTLAATRQADRDLFDPIIGLKLRHPLTKELHLNLWGDIGGFGVDSDFIWSATGVLGYDFDVFGLGITLYGGYRAMSWDYSDSDGLGFELDAVLHGPTLGFQIRF